MTEADWLAGADPQKMLEFLRSRADRRKLRLFACGCCRRVGRLLTDVRSQRAVEMAERLADGSAEKDRSKARRAARRVGEQARRNDARAAGRAAAWSLVERIEDFVQGVSQNAAEASAWHAARQADPDYTDPERADAAWAAAFDAERSSQCQLLRCVFGNPFRPIPRDPAWVSWQDGLVVLMARRMYDSREFADMPVLADALEEAGCANLEVLSHCRQQGAAHVRGCWILDLLLEKT